MIAEGYLHYFGWEKGKESFSNDGNENVMSKCKYSRYCNHFVTISTFLIGQGYGSSSRIGSLSKDDGYGYGNAKKPEYDWLKKEKYTCCLRAARAARISVHFSAALDKTTT